AQWRLIYDGVSVSLSPSVGNWDLPCRSHYWIRNNKIEWAKPWDTARIEAGLKRDDDALDSFFVRPPMYTSTGHSVGRKTLRARIRGWFGKGAGDARD